MCIIVDPPLFVALFNKLDQRHSEFEAVLAWVKSGSGKFVLGGTKYAKELQAIGNYLKLLAEFERLGRVVRANSAQVDTHEAWASAQINQKSFDDPHLVALVLETGCRLICTNDLKSHKYLRNSSLYVNGKNRPKLYTRLKNKKLLANTNIAPCCT